MRALIAGLLMLLAVPAAAAERAQVRLADILISYDAERWLASSEIVPATVRFSGLKLGRRFVTFHCIAKPPVCFDEPMLFASARPASGDAADMPLLDFLRAEGGGSRPLWDTPGSRRDAGGLILTATRSFSGCRARTPAMLKARGEHDGTTYSFASGFSAGCGGIEGVPEKMFDELIAGIELVNPDPETPKP